MAIGSIVPYTPQTDEEAKGTDSHVVLVAGGLRHEVDKETGQAAICSSYDGTPWVTDERVSLEHLTGRDDLASWDAVGGQYGAAAEGGQSVCTTGGAAGRCEVHYAASAEGSLKVGFRVRATAEGPYRVRWSLRGLRGTEVAGALDDGLRFADGGALLDVDWTDVVRSHGSAVVSVTGSGPDREIVFGPFALAAGEEVLLDPLVSTPWDYQAYTWESGRRLARGPDGRLYTVYADIAKESPWKIQVYFQESADEGQTWSAPVRVSTATGQDAKDCRPGAIAVDSQGDAHVVYSGASGAYCYGQIWHVRRAAGVWQAPVRICTASGMTSEQTMPAITVDPDDNLHVAWNGPATGSDGIQVWCATRLNDTWQAPVRVSSGTGEYRCADIAADAGGGIHVTYSGPWYQGVYGDPQIWHAERVSGVWEAQVRISTAPGMDTQPHATDPSIALTADGGVHVVWAGRSTTYNTNLQIWYAHRTTTWQAPVRLSTASGMQTANQLFPTIAPDTAGRLHVLWESGTAYASKRIYRAIFDGAAWSAPILMTPAYRSQRPSLRWSSFNNNGGCLDWIWLEGGTDIQFAPGSGLLYEPVTPTGWRGQTFTATEPVGVRAIGVHVRNDSTPRQVTLALYATSQGLPTGAPLVTFNGTIPDFGGAFGWLTFGLSESQDVRLTAGNVYCLVLYPNAGTVHWHFPIGYYAGGNLLRSEDSGQTWTPDTDPDATNDVGFGIYVQYNLQYTRDETAQPADAIAVPSVPLVSTVTYTYDAAGRVIAVEDPLGYRTTTSYDANGAIREVLDARGSRTTYSYDAAGRRTEVLDARDFRTSFVYDSAGQLAAQLDQLGQRVTYSYDDAGRLATRLDAKGQLTTYHYDDAGRQTRAEYSDGGRVTFSYDAAGSRIGMEDGTGVTQYGLDALNRVCTVVYAGAKTFTYDYDETGNRKRMTDPEGGITTYSYDSRGLLSWLLNPQSERTTWLYDAAGRPTTMTHANGALAEWDYNGLGWTTAVRNLKSDRSVLSALTHTYDAAGTRTGVVEASGDRVTWSYDGIYQLVREQRSGANGYDVSYSYDALGNRLTKLEGGVITTYSYDEANQLSYDYTPALRTTYGYDANGNTTLVNAGGSVTTYCWDIENRMTLAELPTGGRTTATYDGDGKRRSYADSAGSRGFLWDGENIARETDGAGATTAAYSYAPSGYGALLSQRRGGATSFHHYDALGSTVQLTDASQSPTDSYLYRAFGEQSVLSGSSPNPFTWVGRLGYYRQPDTSDYWVRARVYGATRGRWVSRDLIWSDLNRFRYALGSPVVFVDRNGLEAARELGRQAAIRIVGQSAEAAAPSLFGRAVLFAGRLLGPLGLLLTDPGNIMSAEEEAELAAQSHAWPEVAPQSRAVPVGDISPQDRTRDQCNCMDRHKRWPMCNPTLPATPEGALWSKVMRDPWRERVNLDHWCPTNPLIEEDRPGAADFCENRAGVLAADVPGDYHVLESRYKERPGYTAPQNQKRGPISWSIMCCSCCGPAGEQKQCYRLHPAGKIDHKYPFYP